MEYTEGMRSVCSAGTPQQVLLEKCFPWIFRINCVLLSGVVGCVHKNHHSTVHFRKAKARGRIHSEVSVVFATEVTTYVLFKNTLLTYVM